MRLKALLISLLCLGFSDVEYRFVNVDHGVYVQNYAPRAIYCYIGQYEFIVKGNSKSRVYPASKSRHCE